jgi:hypothetical protein
MDANDDRDPPLGNPPSAAKHAQNPPRKHKPSLKTRLKEACEAGAKAGAKAVLLLPDGTVSITFGGPAEPQRSELDEWMANHANQSKGD